MLASNSTKSGSQRPLRPSHPPASSRPRLSVAMVTLTMAIVAALSLAIVPSCTLDPMGSAEPGTLGTGGAGQVCDENADCPGEFSECQHPLCINAICGTHYEPAAANCTENDGVVCDGAGECVECVDATQCNGDELCQANECVPAFCGDGVLNGDETDLDCGGSCAPCQDGQFCGGADDCVSGYCASNGICAPCSVHGDCAQGFYCCIPGLFACDPANPEHLDRLNHCREKEGPNAGCTEAIVCASGFCPEDDHVCCDSPCEGFCESCKDGDNGVNAEGHDNGPGVCGFIPSDTDPETECSQEPRSTCLSDGRGCDGSGACLLWPSGTVCDPQHCEGGDTQHHDDTCDGAGTCNDGGLIGCSPYICDDNTNACRGNCTVVSHCLSTAYCNAPNCVSDGNLGSACGADNECQSDHCEDGRCCENACSGECMACSANKTDGPDGECQAITHNTNPDNECSNGACYRVSASDGECRLYQGYSCGGNSDCMNNICRDGRCCENNCGGECMACRGDWTVGSNGQCRAITSYTDPDNDECPNGACYNNSGTGDCRLYVGYGCGSSTDCLYGNCVDGRCCENSCTSGCMGCRGAITVGSDGQCRNIIGDTDPNNDCQTPLTNNCDGSGSCQDGNGNTCSDPITCTSGYCEDGYCCNSSCSGTCVACRGDWTVGSSGTCSNITTGEDYENECGSQLPSTCGRTGDCEAGACQLHPFGTQCVPPSCTPGDSEYYRVNCDGDGHCDEGGGSSSCWPYTGCNGDVCDDSCGGDGECESTYWCDGSDCQADLAAGDENACSRPQQCDGNNNCVQGYCCTSACDVGCVSCLASETAALDGTCSNINVSGIDPNDHCSSPNCCADDASGNCGSGGGCT